MLRMLVSPLAEHKADLERESLVRLAARCFGFCTEQLYLDLSAKVEPDTQESRVPLCVLKNDDGSELEIFSSQQKLNLIGRARATLRLAAQLPAGQRLLERRELSRLIAENVYAVESGTGAGFISRIYGE